MYEFTHRSHHEPWSKPSKNEEDYFHRLELEARQEHERRRQAERRAASRPDPTACPACGTTLRRASLPEEWADECPLCQGPVRHVPVKEAWVDRCPDCGGVWVEGPVYESLTRREPHPLQDLFRGILLEYSMARPPGRGQLGTD